MSVVPPPAPTIVWVCGCRTMNGEKAYYIQPCRRIGCEIEPAVKEECRRRGRKLEIQTFGGRRG